MVWEGSKSVMSLSSPGSHVLSHCAWRTQEQNHNSLAKATLTLGPPWASSPEGVHHSTEAGGRGREGLDGHQEEGWAGPQVAAQEGQG